MQIDFRNLPIFWLNLAARTDRAESMNALFRRMGNTGHERIEAIVQDPYFIGCNQSHQKALRLGLERGRFPFLVLEDDVSETPFFRSSLQIPDGCPWIYFGISNWNNFPENLAENRLSGLSSFEPFDSAFLRIRNVLSAHAILYTDAGICRTLLGVLEEYDRKQWHFDVGFAETQNRLTCLAPLTGPFFVQDDPKTRWCTSRYFSPTPLSAGQVQANFDHSAVNGHLVLFCRHLGGYGGEERLNQAIIDAIPNIRTTVFVQNNLNTYGMVPAGRPNLSVHRFKPVRFLRFLHRNRDNISWLLKISPDPYAGETSLQRYLAAVPYPKIINPAGKPVTRVAAAYDHIGWECDNAADFGFSGHPKNILLRPPALQPAPAGAPLQFLPDRPYYLTAFNNYDAKLKGTDDLSSILGRLGHPLVWCAAHFGADAPEHPDLIRMSPDRETLQMLIRHCRAYISFSRSEGFSWSVFEAMVSGRPVFSRPVGVAREFSAHIHPYESPEELTGLLAAPYPEKVSYPLSAFTAPFFFKNLLCLLRPEIPREHGLRETLRYWREVTALRAARFPGRWSRRNAT